MSLNLIQRWVLLLTGVTLTLIGISYCIDPNFLLARYELSVAGISEDNMYRGAYGGLFITVGLAVSFGFFSKPFLNTATTIVVLFMGGFAIGRVASILARGMPHEQIVGLLVFEIASSMLFIWFLLKDRKVETVG